MINTELNKFYHFYSKISINGNKSKSIQWVVYHIRHTYKLCQKSTNSFIIKVTSGI